MAQKWHQKASVQSSIVNALIGVIPATMVGIVTIWVQIDLATKQADLGKQASKEQETKDSLAAIRATKRYHSDSLLDSKDLELNRLQFELAQLKREDDIALNGRLERINKNQLMISESQYALQKKRVESQEINDLLRFNSAVTELDNLISDYGSSVEDFRGRDSWVRKVIKTLESQLDNPILQVDKALFEEWTSELGLLNVDYWIYNIDPRFKSMSTDSLKRWMVRHPYELAPHEVIKEQVVNVRNLGREFYDSQTYKRMGFPRIRVEADNSEYMK